MARLLLAHLFMFSFTVPALAGKLIIKDDSSPSFIMNISCTAQGPSEGTLSEVGKNSFKGDYVSRIAGSCEMTAPQEKVIPLDIPAEEAKSLAIKILSPTSVFYKFDEGEGVAFDAQITFDAKGEAQKIVIKDTEQVKKGRKIMMARAGDKIMELQSNAMAKKFILYINDLVCKRSSGGMNCKTVGGIEIAIGQ